MSESEQKLQEELKKAKEKNTELEKSLDAMSKEMMHPKVTVVSVCNIKTDSKQLEFFTCLSRETWVCVWDFWEFSPARTYSALNLQPLRTRGGRLSQVAVVNALFLWRISFF